MLTAAKSVVPTELDEPVESSRERKHNKSLACLVLPELCLGNKLQTPVFFGAKTGDHKTAVN
jgi:hypothetical protein